MPRFMPTRRKVLARRSSHAEPLEIRRLLACFHPSLYSDAVDGDTLRAAVIAANANGEDNKIFLKAGRFELTIPNSAGQENNAQEGDLDLTSAGHQIWIVGAGADKTVIDANGIDRILQVFPDVTLVLKKVTLTGGIARDDGEIAYIPDSIDGPAVQGAALGGAILSNGGCMEIRNVVIQCNVADSRELVWGEDAQGGGIWTDAPLFMSRVTLLKNAAIAADGESLAPVPVPAESVQASSVVDGAGPGGDAAGGAVYSEAFIQMCRTTVMQNLAQAGAGGSIVEDELDSISGSAGDGGEALGGGIYAGSICAVLSLIKGNLALGGDGGGTTPGIVGAYTSEAGNGGDALGGGLYIADEGTLSQMQIACNKAAGGDGGLIVDPVHAFGGSGGLALGGGIYFEGCQLTIACDSSIAANWACGGEGTYGSVSANSGTGGRAAGGGVACQTSDAIISFCDTVVTLNHAAAGASAYGEEGAAAAAYGGGIAVNPFLRFIITAPNTDGTDQVSGPTLTLDHTIVSFNTAAGGDGLDGRDSAETTFTNARTAGDGSDATGGGIYMYSGTATFTCSEASRNLAKGGDGGDGGNLLGEIIVVAPGDAQTDAIDDFGGHGGYGGNAEGGGVATEATQVTLTDFNVWCNAAIAGNGGEAGDAILVDGTTLAPSQIAIGVGGTGGHAGSARGGGLYLAGPFFTAQVDGDSIDAIACLTRVDVYANRAIGGDGGDGGLFCGNGGRAGDAEGGGIYATRLELKLTDTKVPKNKAIAGDGGNAGQCPIVDPTSGEDVEAAPGVAVGGYGADGGNAFGGGVRVGPSGELLLQGCTAVYFNCVAAGQGGEGLFPGDDGIALDPDISTAIYDLLS